MSTDAARLVDELTPLLYGVLKRWEVAGLVCEIVQCGACRKKADKPESVVHDSDCPVYRLQRAEAANTAVIRANAEEIADLEDVRDELEAQVNALTAQMECRNELTARIRALEVENERGQQAFADLTLASVERINALEAERDAATKRVATLENDLEHALASVGAFRQAIEDVWAKSAGESGDDGFIVSYVIPVGVLHRAIGLARGTDAGGKLLTRLAASEAARERSADRIRDALDCLPRALDGSQPFSMGQRAEVMLAIESLRAALAAAPEARDVK